MEPVQIVFLIAAAVALVQAAWLGMKGYRASTVPPRLLQGPSSEGRIVQPQSGAPDDESPSSADLGETIEFTDARGNTVRGRPAFREPGQSARDSDVVTVYYDRERPSTFIAPLTPGTFNTRSARNYVVLGASLVPTSVLCLVLGLALG